MTVESYDLMKITFDYFCSNQFKPCVNNPFFFILYDNYSDYIRAGWCNPKNIDDYDNLYVVVKKDEMQNFNQKIYEEKVAELTKKVKEYYVNKRLQTIEGDFEE